jgi:hypothetical protein
MKIKLDKAHRRHAIWWWMVFWLVFCIGVLLGVNIALLVFASTSVVLVALLEGLPGATNLAYVVSLAIALLLGTAFLVGYLWTFAGASSTFETAAAYAEAHGLRFPWPQALVIALEGFFIALDLISLLYRRQFFATKGAEQLFWFFVVLSLMSPILGLLMHILENKPLSYRLSEIRQHTANLVGDDLQALVGSMPFEHRVRALSGDETAVQEHLEQLRMREEEARQVEEQRRQERQATEQARKQERENKRNQTRSPLATASLLNQAQQGSQKNGHLSQ